MAIKISGSTIIDDSRNIVNAGVTTVGVLTGTDARFSGTVEANEYLGSGTKLTGIVTSIVAGSNISVDQSTGRVTITGLANTANVVSETINTGSLNVTGITTLAGNTNISGNITSNVTIVSTDDGSAAAPEFKLYRNSASPDDGDYLGQIKFAGESDTGVERNYAKITGKIKDASNGTEDGIIEVAHIKNGSQNISARWNSETLQLINDTQISVAGTATFTGPIDANGALDVDGQTDLDVLNVAELATFTDNIVANGNIVGDNLTNISGINSVTATTYFGDGSNLTNIISGVGVQTSGGYIGAGVTTLDFRGAGVSTVTDPSSGFSTVFVDFNGQGAIWSKNESNFTASEGQTTFTKTYQPGYVDVYLNGVRQISGDNYTATNGTSVGLTTATNAGDKVDIIAYNTDGAASLSLSRTVGLVTATAGQTAFTVPSYDLGNNSLDVYLNGIKLEPTEYTETNGTTITLGSGAKVGDILQAFSYDVSGGNYWQLTGNVVHRSPLYNAPVGIGTDKQTDENADLTVGQLGVGSTSLVVHGKAVFKGNVSIAGTLTSENKTNIDSLGIVTARTGVDVDAGGVNIDAGGLNVVAGVSTFGQRLLINTTTSRIVEDSSGNGPQGLIQIEGLNSDAMLSIIAAKQADTFRSGCISLGAHRGTVGSTPTILQDGDTVGGVLFAAGDGTDMRTKTAQIISQVDGSPSANDVPGRLVFSTRTGGGSLSERLRIDSSGNIGVGGLTNPGALLSIPAGESDTPRFAIESAADDNDFTITQYEDGNGTYTMVGQNVKLNSGGNITILDSGHRTAGILLDARNHGSITFLTGGTNAVEENVKINSSGYVAIGTATPSRKVDVLTLSSESPPYSLKDSASTGTGAQSALTLAARTSGTLSAGYGPAMSFEHREGGSAYAGGRLASLANADKNTADLVFYPRNYGYTEALRIRNNGFVGINTNIPAKALEVTSNTVPQFQVGMANNGARASLMHNGSHLYFDTTLGDIVFRTNTSTTRATIDSSGRMLIAVNSSYANANADDLQVGNNNSASESGMTFGSTTASGIRFADAGNASAGIIEYAHATDQMKFQTPDGTITLDGDGIDSSGAFAGMPVKITSTALAPNALEPLYVGTGDTSNDLAYFPDYNHTVQMTKPGNSLYICLSGGILNPGPNTSDAIALYFRIMDRTGGTVHAIKTVGTSYRGDTLEAFNRSAVLTGINTTHALFQLGGFSRYDFRTPYIDLRNNAPGVIGNGTLGGTLNYTFIEFTA